MIPTEHPFVRGWYMVAGIPVYITSGLGEVLLPLRFLIPPEIVIMDFKI
jgi:predicted MPP superfamily phosphohydrolase